jgi:hypothetical protein
VRGLWIALIDEHESLEAEGLRIASSALHEPIAAPLSDTAQPVLEYLVCQIVHAGKYARRNACRQARRDCQLVENRPCLGRSASSPIELYFDESEAQAAKLLTLASWISMSAANTADDTTCT